METAYPFSMTTVQQQYERWVYPLPTTDLDEVARRGGYDYGDPSRFAPAIWPERPYRPNASILIAGCGTNQAAYFAYMNRGSRVLGFDISEPSLQHSQSLKEKHGLDNLELRKLNLFDADTLAEEFDLVVSTGVLHHTPDPADGARVLARRMKDDGTLAVALYGLHARVGVYMMQDVFRRLSIGQQQSDVDLVKNTVFSLPAAHPLRAVLETSDVKYDAGLVDLFLHPADRAYTVDQVFDFIDATGLTFQNWVDGRNYTLAEWVPRQLPIFSRISELPVQEQWAIIEQLSCAQLLHSFFARKSPELIWSPDWEWDGWLESYPRLRIGAEFVAEGGFPILARGKSRVTLSEGQAMLLSSVDGRRTVRETLRDVLGGAFPSQAGLQPTRDLFRYLYEASYLQMSARSSLSE